jgi:hypothetical protein
MSQIKPTQIIPGRENKINPVSPLPIDLDPTQRSLALDPIFTLQNPIVDQTIGDDFAFQSIDSVITESDPTPATPAILSVKEEIVKFMPDGTAKIDIILEIQDVNRAVEYDIRVAKDAGNI